MKDTLNAFNSIKYHEETIQSCQDIFKGVYTPMLDMTGEEIQELAFTAQEREDESLTIKDM